jgi:hypothetical protein
VTASPARHELLRTLGATQCFHYASPTVTDDVLAAVEALGQGLLAHALDAVGAMESRVRSLEAWVLPSLISYILQPARLEITLFGMASWFFRLRAFIGEIDDCVVLKSKYWHIDRSGLNCSTELKR